MAGDYIPSSDADFTIFATQFIGAFAAEQATLGFSAGQVTALTALLNEWISDRSEADSALANYKVTVVTQDAARKMLEEAIRAYARQVQANPATTDAIRTEFGITVPDTTPTANLLPPANPPLLQVSTAERLRHTIKFTDGAGGGKAKPKGVKGCEIWVKIDAPPTIDGAGNPTDMSFLALDTATPYVAEFPSEVGGKTAYYMGRWINTRDLRGPWSETVEATVVA